MTVITGTTSLREIFRTEVRAKVGGLADNVVPDRQPTFADVRELYPTGPDLALGLGYGANRDNPKGSRAWRERRNLLDDYSRWRRGGRNPFRRGSEGTARARELSSAVREQWGEAATPPTELDVLRLVVAKGATVTYFEGVFDYEADRERQVSGVYIWPEVLERVGFSEAVRRSPPIPWGDLAGTFLTAWADAYGLDAGFVDEIEGDGYEVAALSWEIGRGEEVSHDYRG